VGRRAGAFCAALLLSLFSSSALLVLGAAQAETPEEPPIPEMSGYISDYAQIVDAKTELALSFMLEALEKRHGCKLVVLTVRSTRPLTTEEYSAAVFSEWALGEDDLLFLVAVEDGRVRLAPGERLGRALTDEKLREIMDEKILPHFEEGNFSQGVLEGTVALVSEIKALKQAQAKRAKLMRMLMLLGLALLAAAALAAMAILP